MFSKIGKAISSAAKSAYNWVSGVSNKVANTLQQANPNAYTASVVNAGLNPNKTVYYDNSGKKYQTNTINAVQVPASVGPVGSASYNQFVASNPQGTSYTDVTYGKQLPVTISAGAMKPSSISAAGGGSSQNFSSNLNLSGYNPAAYAPTTISAKSLGAQTSGTGSLMGTGGVGSTQPVTMNYTPPSQSINNIDNTKIAGGISKYGYKYNPTTGAIEQEQVQPQEDTVDSKIKKQVEWLKKYVPEDPILAEDPEVIRATQQRREIQESLKAPTNELNAIIAKQNQDLLAHRKMVSEGGGTETGFGGIEAAINYNAAIRAIPLQAQIAAIQGDLKSAQDYLTELRETKREQINKQVEANRRQMEMIRGIITKEDERTYNEMNKEIERQEKSEKDLVDFQVETMGKIYENYGANVPQSVINRINNARNKQEVVTAAGQYLAKSVANAGIRQTQTSDDPFIQKLLNSAGGKPMTDTFAQKLDKGLTVLGQIGVLQNNIKDVKTGPILGTFRGANPWDTNAQTIKAQLNAIVPNLARGVYGEVGVLTDNDIATYSKTLPTLKSTEDVRNAVLGITVDLISKSIKRTLEVNAANGKDVSGFVDLYNEMQATRDSIFAQIPGAKVSTGQTTTQQPQQFQLPDGTTVTLQADGTYK